MSGESPVGRILDWLRAGYPDGIPPNDYPPVLGVLHRRLTERDIEQIADELALWSVSNGDVPVSADDVRAMVREKAFQRCAPADLARVSAHLAAGGWPLASDIS
ncbi:DUF3349 domain-containing protein [Nocardioides sp. DS6]|uniref:DUF3349 domain-containing protein n=1 Tax=Nocardioides eburneus TaxID=3231482 RepID=A0ABV3T333_9ACTN